MSLVKFLIAFLLATVMGFSQMGSPLRPREPHWRPKILEYFPEGGPKKVMYYETGEHDQEKAVKQLLYYPNGQLKSEMDLTRVEEGSPGYAEWKSTTVPHGGSVTFFAEGQVEKIAFYDKGIVHGEVRAFYPNGNLHGAAIFNHGIRHGKAGSFYQDGKKAEEVTYENGKVVGELIRYYPSEEKAVSIPYVEGVPHGNALEWHENGALKSCRHYVNGLLSSDGRNPAAVFYDENRNMIEVQDFQNGQQVGFHLKYHPNGKESFKVRFREGKKHGKEQFFSTKGELIGEGEYFFGVPQGNHWRKHENGNNAFTASYNKEGELLEPIIHYNEQGRKISEYTLIGEVKDGLHREWYDNGQLKGEYRYVKGQFEGEQKEFYPNLKPKMRALFKDQKREGLYEEWYENGQLALQIHYKEGEREGPTYGYYENGTPHFSEFYTKGSHDKEQKQWHSNGKLKFQGSFAQGKKHGRHQQWDEEGSLIMQANFIEDQPDGKVVTFFAKNKPHEAIFFKKGKREGKGEEYYENGKLKTVAFYKEDLLDGELKGWHEDGSLSMVKYFSKGTPIKKHTEYFPLQEGEKEGQIARIFSYNSDGQFEGEQYTYYPNGTTQTVVSYKNGELNGIKSLLDEKGNLLEEAYYHLGKLEGRFFQKDKDGKEIVFHYKQNKKEGLHEIYYPPNEFFGKVKALEANFVNDKVEGDLIEYNEAGVKVAMTPYKNGIKEGIASIFTPRGKPFLTVTFKNDHQNGPIIQYFPNGKVQKEGTLLNDQREGEERAYFEDGKLQALAFYVKGLKSGLYQEWNRDGVLVFEGEFKEGKRHGKFNKYYDNGKPKIIQTFIDDQLDGVKKVYDAQGELTETKYELGKRI